QARARRTVPRLHQARNRALHVRRRAAARAAQEVTPAGLVRDGRGLRARGRSRSYGRMMWYVLNGAEAAPTAIEPVAPWKSPVPLVIGMTIGGRPSLTPFSLATIVPPGSREVATMSAVAPAHVSVEHAPWSTYWKIIEPTFALAPRPNAGAVLLSR